LFALLRTLRQRHDLTIIYASSSLKDVVELADTIHLLEQGQLIFSGTPREVAGQIDILQRLDIALPEATQIALTLRQGLSDLRTDVLDQAELQAALSAVLPHQPAQQQDAPS
jgi:energy-coupling factor transport system ATP-binding protein